MLLTGFLSNVKQSILVKQVAKTSRVGLQGVHQKAPDKCSVLGKEVTEQLTF